MSEIYKESIRFVKKNKQQLLDQFASDEICLPEEDPISIFMAGSPGAGKTEVSKNLISEYSLSLIRIDADEVRGFIPMYNGKNSDKVQGAASLGVQKIFDYALSKKKSLLLDGTFANLDLSYENVSRSINRGRPTIIFYVYQDPVVAWNFTKAREEIEGRHVPRDVFIEAFIKAKDNVNRVKEFFGNRIKLHLVEKGFESDFEKLRLNIGKIDNYIEKNYNIDQLNDIL